MPLYDGLMVLDQLKDDLRTRRIPVFILTGNQDDHHFLESYRLGATSYITKPLTAQKFRAALKEAGLTWMLKARGPVKAAAPAKAPAPREHREPRARAAISR
jgi:two-component system response regulator